MRHLPNIVHTDIATMLVLFKENKYRLITTFFVIIGKTIREMLIIRDFMTRMKLQYVRMGLQDDQCENFNGFCRNLKRKVVDGRYNAYKLHCLNRVIYLSSPYITL